MTGAHDEDEHSGREADVPTPWHHSTTKVLGASIAALAALALVVSGVMFVSRTAAETPQAPLNFVDPTFTSATTDSTTAATATTTTRISPPQTTDLDLPPEIPSSVPPPPEPTSTSRGRSTTQEESDDNEESAPPTSTRNRPRLNETRTLYPRP
ncbi:hypothetical protein [Mycolicibacterium baixiangningiae]|uniref:hypothetical protein n=1 Tax=Mycolicibacterium baixiangningiae TaxID=2761578 RepID=UPI001E36505F|nr:hypothetical protein [Mycolicibacterium baixiangningiae]